MAHTKGKWLVMGNQRNGHLDFVLPMADDRDFQANARLIASAPELLEACKEAVKFLDDGSDMEFRRPHQYNALKKCKQAILLAEGKE